jgi:GTP-binding protein HflX
MVFNKMDTLPGGVPAGHGSAVAVSARTGEGLPALVAAIGERLGVSAPVELLLRPDEGRTRAWLYSMGAVLDEQTREDGSLALTVQADADVLARLDGAHHHGRFVAPPQGQP